MDQKSKGPRDLSDLKARLGLKKPDAAPAPGAAPSAVAPPGVAQPAPQPYVSPPGYVPPPGAQAPQPVAPQPAAPEVRRDPFAPTAAPAAVITAAEFVDRGPLIDIPEEKKGKSKWVFILLALGVVSAGVGWSCGRIYGARLVFNKTITDAKVILDELKPIMDTNMKMAEALQKSRMRAKKGLEYDDELVKEMGELLTKADLRETKQRQDRIFRTNYARMEDLTVQKLFAYYNNTLRLYATVTQFVDQSKRNEKEIKAYRQEAGEQRNYGVVFASDEGGYYLGKLVQVGPPVCEGDKKECRPNKVKGFPVRVGNSRAWSQRPGKAKRIEEIVVPIMPDEDWRQVAVGRPGYLLYRQYALHFGQLVGISALLLRDEKELSRNLSKQSNRQQLFAPL